MSEDGFFLRHENGMTQRGGAHRSEKAKEFLRAIQEVCKTFQLSLGHEDTQGAFLVLPFSAELDEWLSSAREETPPTDPDWHKRIDFSTRPKWENL